jgi:hypothetical protein
MSRTLKEGMTYLSLGRFRPVLDFGEQLGFDPDSAVGDALAVGLNFSDKLE